MSNYQHVVLSNLGVVVGLSSLPEKITNSHTMPCDDAAQYVNGQYRYTGEGFEAIPAGQRWNGKEYEAIPPVVAEAENVSG